MPIPSRFASAFENQRRLSIHDDDFVIPMNGDQVFVNQLVGQKDLCRRSVFGDCCPGLVLIRPGFGEYFMDGDDVAVFPVVFDKNRPFSGGSRNDPIFSRFGGRFTGRFGGYGLFRFLPAPGRSLFAGPFFLRHLSFPL
ncbi:MAG: hypothetical protein ACKVX9_08980 [Blastocatellia bacterium]